MFSVPHTHTVTPQTEWGFTFPLISLQCMNVIVAFWWHWLFFEVSLKKASSTLLLCKHKWIPVKLHWFVKCIDRLSVLMSSHYYWTSADTNSPCRSSIFLTFLIQWGISILAHGRSKARYSTSLTIAKSSYKSSWMPVFVKSWFN